MEWTKVFSCEGVSLVASEEGSVWEIQKGKYKKGKMIKQNNCVDLIINQLETYILLLSVHLLVNNTWNTAYEMNIFLRL